MICKNLFLGDPESWKNAAGFFWPTTELSISQLEGCMCILRQGKQNQMGLYQTKKLLHSKGNY